MSKYLACVVNSSVVTPNLVYGIKLTEKEDADRFHWIVIAATIFRSLSKRRLHTRFPATRTWCHKWVSLSFLRTSFTNFALSTVFGQRLAMVWAQTTLHLTQKLTMTLLHLGFSYFLPSLLVSLSLYRYVY